MCRLSYPGERGLSVAQRKERERIRKSWAASQERVSRIWAGLPPGSQSKIESKEKRKSVMSKAFNADAVGQEFPEGVKLADFVGYMPTHAYIYVPTREMWPAASVNSRIDPVAIVDENGKPILDSNKKIQTIPANQWIDKNNPVEQMTWSPGEPMLIKGRLIANGGWIHQQGVTCFNQYKPPIAIEGDPSKADRWVQHA